MESAQKILVVDDDIFIRELFEQILNDAGYIVYAVGNAENALQMFNKERVQVMFIDLDLPGMSGIELCREIMKLQNDVIAYAITGYANVYHEADCRQAGFAKYFTKPVTIKDLLNAAEEAFAKLAAQPQHQ